MPPKKKALATTIVKVKHLSLAKIRDLNKFLEGTDEHWDTRVSAFASLMSSEVHKNLVHAMLAALGMDAADSIEASCDFILSAVKLGFTSADALLATSLQDISKSAIEVEKHDEILSLLKMAAIHGTDIGAQDLPGHPSPLQPVDPLSQMQSMMTQMQSMMATLAAKGTSSPPHAEEGMAAPLDEQDTSPLLTQLLSKMQDQQGSSTNASQQDQLMELVQMLNKVPDHHGRSTHAPQQDQLMDLVEALSIKTMDTQEQRLKQATMQSPRHATPQPKAGPSSQNEALLNQLQHALLGSTSNPEPQPSTTPVQLLLNHIMEGLQTQNKEKLRDKEIAATLHLSSPHVHEWPTEWPRLVGGNSPPHEKIRELQRKLTEETANTSKDWQQYQIFFITTVIGQILNGDKMAALTSCSRRLSFLKKLGDGATVKEADRFHQSLEGGSTRPATHTRAELECNLYSKRFPAESAALLRSGDNDTGKPPDQQVTQQQGGGAGGRRGRGRHP